jgi:hypothetical protein
MQEEKGFGINGNEYMIFKLRYEAAFDQRFFACKLKNNKT